MPKHLAITSFNTTLYEEYAHRFVDTYRGDVDLLIVSEDWTHPNYRTLKLTAHRVFKSVNSWRTPTSYKQDAVRFCHKPYAVWTAYHEVTTPWNWEYDTLTWFDADTVFKQPITQEFIDSLYVDGIMSYCGRSNYYSETGLLHFNLNTSATGEYLEHMIELYNTNRIYELAETHDSYVWDYVRTRFERRKDKNKTLQFRNLAEHITHPVPGGHIINYLYGNTIDHCKGKRKQQGYSREQQHDA